jgi:hypothetical protein
MGFTVVAEKLVLTLGAWVFLSEHLGAVKQGVLEPVITGATQLDQAGFAALLGDRRRTG